jgi:hypothetical protein
MEGSGSRFGTVRIMTDPDLQHWSLPYLMTMSNYDRYINDGDYTCRNAQRAFNLTDTEGSINAKIGLFHV